MFLNNLFVYSLTLFPGTSKPSPSQKDVFGGSKNWKDYNFLTVTDRLRGGSSQSYLKIYELNNTATFYGNLDTKTLGGAGFATQSVESPNVLFDFSFYYGLELSYKSPERKKYTINLSNQYSAFLPNGSKPSTLEFQAAFISEISEADGEPKKVLLPFTSFSPIERGRPSNKTGVVLDLGNIRKIAFQLRSFFDAQSGPFSIDLIKLTVV